MILALGLPVKYSYGPQVCVLAPQKGMKWKIVFFPPPPQVCVLASQMNDLCMKQTSVFFLVPASVRMEIHCVENGVCRFGLAKCVVMKLPDVPCCVQCGGAGV